MAEQVNISEEEYKKLLDSQKAQQELFNVIEQLKNQVASITEQNEKIHAELDAIHQQADIFTMLLSRIYASQSIEETLMAMAELGSNGVHAKECAVYSVDVYNENEMFTVDKTGERTYLSFEETSLIRQSVAQHQPIVINEPSADSFIGDGTKADDFQNLLIVPLEDKNGDVIGLAVAKDKDGGFTQEDVEAFNLNGGKIGNTFRIGLENKALQQKATTDALTHLSNREGMNQFIKQQALPHFKHGGDVSVMLFDIDHFKTFNDTYGHDVGDDCLKLVADTLSANLRSNEDSKVFRWGGEEMVVIVPVNEAKAAEIAQRLREAVQNTPLMIEGKEPAPVTVSCGVAQLDSEKAYEISKSNVLEFFEQTFEKADSALYFAKENGRNQICKSGTIENNLLLNANLAENVVASGLAENVWKSDKDDFTLAYSNITKKNCPEIIDMLVERAEAHRSDGFNNQFRTNENAAVNFIVDKNKGTYAELELTTEKKRIEVPLTSKEQAVIKDALVNFMKEHNIEVSDFLENSNNKPKERNTMEEKPNNANNYAELLEEMLGVMDYTVEKSDKGEYMLFDNQTNTYLDNHDGDDTFKNAEEIVIRVDRAISEYILENLEEAVQDFFPDIPCEYSTEKELDEFIKGNPDIYQELQEEGYDYDLQYLDLVANHIDEVNMEQLFSEKWIDNVTIDEKDGEVMQYDENKSVLDIRFDVDPYATFELLKTTDFDWGKPIQEVDIMDETCIEYADLYVEYHEGDTDNPVYTLSVQTYDDKQTFSNEPEGDIRPMIISEDMKASIAHNVDKFLEGASVDEIIDQFKSNRDMTD